VGNGLDKNVVEAYYFIVNNWEGPCSEYPDEQPDEIYLFGFSRGAYTVRCLAGLIDCIGVLKKTDMDKFHKYYDQYKDHKGEELKKQSPGRKAKIKVVGVWDTVGSLGVPEYWFVKKLGMNAKHKFHRPTLSDSEYYTSRSFVKIADADY
jgi:uncharacterized protein (DUF2235 family)